ncbi:hypothetical protein CCO03_18670 [Comamonas serinivorans]|uniref:N-acetyltransferase domain-containing protein n=1 Tax=Comamonas serinivorans TaxID=1082851 RepID=A0A1Y0ES37_9BURK|nr:GNAT family N-acetyltransferase [Comamonas serinivorans]ARU06413.1 hypothetical protein CCO03_18670 [Comamonas serinivorans]
MTLPPIVLNEAAQRFELHLDGFTAYEAFERFPGGINYLHTVVPEQLSGRGIGGAIARHVLDYAAEHQLQVIPTCVFIRGYIEKHPEYQRLVATHP